MFMTDEQYIEKLLEKNIDQSEVNQLLKIYTYTKEHDFILNYTEKLDTETLRDIATFFKKEDLSETYYDLLKRGQEHNCDIVPYLLIKYQDDVLKLLINMEIDGMNMENLKNPLYNSKQINCLCSLMLDEIMGVNEHCANPEYSVETMEKIGRGLRYEVILKNYVDIDKLSIYQCDAIANILTTHGSNPLIDFDIVANPKFSSQVMCQIADLMILEKPYDLLLNEEYSDYLCNALYRAIKANRNVQLIEDILLKEHYKPKQLIILLDILTRKGFDIKAYDYNKIFNPKNNYYKILLYDKLVRSGETKFLDKIIDKDYKVEQIVDLFNLYKKGIDIDSLENIDDIKSLHLYKRKLELEPFGKKPEDFMKTKNPPPEPIKQKYEIEVDYFKNQFFLTEDNCILEVYHIEDYSTDILGTVCDEMPKVDEEMMLFKEDIIEVLKNRLIISVDEESETIDLYDLVDNITIQIQVDKYTSNDYFTDYLLDSNQVYLDMYDAILERFDVYDIMDNIDTPFNSPFDSIEEIMDAVPNFSDKLKVFVFGDMSETLYYTVREDDIIDKYGYADEETFALAQKEFEETSKLLDAIEECRVYECIKYDMNGKKIKEGRGYYDNTAIENIEKDFGKLVKNLGLHQSITAAITHQKNEMIEER